MMRVLAALAGLTLLSDGGAAPPAAGAGPVGGKRPACVAAAAYIAPSYGGHDHIVSVHNACKKHVACEVYTDVAPQHLPQALPPGESIELVTFRGSPASVFVATVDCTEK